MKTLFVLVGSLLRTLMELIYINMIMSRKEMIDFVDDQLNKGFDKIVAIKNLAVKIKKEQPDEDFAEIWFQQIVSGE